MKKIKILFHTEISSAKSGFGKIGRELIPRLVANDKFEVAELSGFGAIEDSDYSHVKWKCYPVAVRPGHPEFDFFNSNAQNNCYGAWRFDRIALDFKPDIVFTFQDPWNANHVHSSPFRKFFHFCTSYTCDSIPQQVSWFDNFKDSDSMFTYADWCIPYLRKYGFNPLGALYPGVDTKIYKVKDKIEARKRMGLPEDAYIIGTTMRNQPRKLFAELFKAFRIYLDKYGNTEIGKKTYLYLHTSYPDNGWDLPDLLNEFGLMNRVYFSYVCNRTRKHFVSKFCGGGRPLSAPVWSHFSNSPDAAIPSVGNGYTEDQLVDAYNTMDLYVQYANCEGLGLGQLEAAACGVVIASVDYSAMEDCVKLTHGIPLKPASIPRDLQMKADRVAPDNEFAADAFYKFLSLDKKYKEKRSKSAREGAEKNFDWDICANKLTAHFESIKLTGLQGKWDAPIQIGDMNIPNMIEGLTNKEFILWVTSEVAKNPQLAHNYTGVQWLSWLNNGGFTNPGQGFNGINRETIYNICKALGTNKILGERARVGMDQLNYPDFIEFAHLIEKGN
jgi:glycosyltransferase involved in cell wall biosynthesis